VSLSWQKATQCPSVTKPHCAVDLAASSADTAPHELGGRSADSLGRRRCYGSRAAQSASRETERRGARNSAHDHARGPRDRARNGSPPCSMAGDLTRGDRDSPDRCGLHCPSLGPSSLIEGVHRHSDYRRCHGCARCGSRDEPLAPASERCGIRDREPRPGP